MQPVWAVIPAAGVGTRLGAEVPKQYLVIHDKPVLLHTLESLCAHPAIQSLVLAVADKDPYIAECVDSIPIALHQVHGGKERADSVLNALRAIPSSVEWVIVHDAARPCLSQHDLNQLLTCIDELEAEGYAGALLAAPLADTLKQIDPISSDVIATVDRRVHVRALTPQLMKRQELIAALESSQLTVTDEAQAMELAGHRIRVIIGSSDNIKITYPEDLLLAERILEKQRVTGIDNQ